VLAGPASYLEIIRPSTMRSHNRKEEQPMITPEIAQVAAQFLQRVTLQPTEIEAFMAVMAALKESIAEQEESAPPLGDS